MSETVTEALNTIRAVVEAGRAAEERLLATRRELELLRRQLPQYDCCFTGGPVADVGGKHCPSGKPCMRCRTEKAEEEVERLSACLSAEGKRLDDLGVLHLATAVRAAKAEAERLKWQQAGSPMPGETPLGE